MNKKTVRSMLRIMLAVLLMAGTVLGIGCGSEQPKKTDEIASEVPVIPEMFWGRQVSNNLKFSGEEADYAGAIKYAKYQMLNLDGQETEMTAFPFEMTVNPESGRMRMLFLDRFATKYCLEGVYQVENDVLTFCPEAVIDAIDADWAKTAEQKNTITPETISYDAVVRFSALNLYIGQDRMTYRNYIAAVTGEYALQGSLSEGCEPYENVVEINAPMPSETDKSNTLLFQDGSFPTDSKTTAAYDDHFAISWQHIEKDYNGRREEFEDYHSVYINYIDTRPYGFICVDKEAKRAIRYQDPLKTLGE